MGEIGSTMRLLLLLALTLVTAAATVNDKTDTRAQAERKAKIDTSDHVVHDDTSYQHHITWPDDSPCPGRMKDFGLSHRFDETVAHAIHDISLDDLRKFNPHTPDENNIPVVDVTYSTQWQEQVRPHAIPRQTSDAFETDVMNRFDNIMAPEDGGVDHEGKPLPGLDDKIEISWRILDRIGHMLHMRDTTAKIRHKYQSMQDGHDDVSDNVCTCVNEIDHNGVKERLKFIADSYTRDTDMEDGYVPTWREWKQRMIYYYGPEPINDAAVYLRCALKNF